MQQYASNGTVGSKLARANMKPANPRARPRNHETVTAARGVWHACLLAFFACPTRLLLLLLLVLVLSFLRLCAPADRWDSPASSLSAWSPLARSVPDSTPLPMSTAPATGTFPALVQHAPCPPCEPGTYLMRSHFYSAWLSLPGDVGMTSPRILTVKLSSISP